MKIAIDVGHADGTGARGNGMEEHAQGALLAPILARQLEELGHTVKVIDFPEMSNKGDLAATTRAANEWGAELFVSLHNDCSDNAAAHGGHVCYLSARGKALAECVAKRLCKLLPGRASAVVQRGDLHVLRATRCVAILCECGFISNAGDAAIIRDRKKEIALAISGGVYEFLQE